MKKKTTVEADEIQEKVKPATSDQLVSGFEKYLESDKKTPTTIKSYARDVAYYLEGIQETEGQPIITPESVKLFWESMIQSTFQASTINTKINSLVAFNRYLMMENLAKEFVVDAQGLRITTLQLLELRATFKEEGKHD